MLYWIPPWCWYYGVGSYVFAIANDPESYFVRVLGLELYVRRESA